jgi:CRISPR/Cas system-associated exonuclease Cas4 (RecB family)
MSKSIETLVHDMLHVVETGEGLTPELLTKYGLNTGAALKEAFGRNSMGPALRMSALGKPCDRQLWYQHTKAPREKLRRETLNKFAYGHIIEEYALLLAAASGHRVEGEQDTMHLEGVVGHRDCVIDGVLIDVKSASGRGFEKFAKNGLREDDPFGYLMQLAAYLEASQDDPLVLNKTTAGFLVLCKESGKVCLDLYDLTPELELIRGVIARKRDVLASDQPPERAFKPVPQSKTSPNTQLGTECRYCDFKQTCWPEARKFLYASGPTWLIDVVKEPNVMEIVD